MQENHRGTKLKNSKSPGTKLKIIKLQRSSCNFWNHGPNRMLTKCVGYKARVKQEARSTLNMSEHTCCQTLAMREAHGSHEPDTQLVREGAWVLIFVDVRTRKLRFHLSFWYQLLCLETNRYTHRDRYFMRFGNSSTSSGDSDFSKYRERFINYTSLTLSLVVW